MRNEFSLAFNEVLEEKQLPKEVILAAIESAMVSAYRRSVNASNAQHIEARVDPETGRVTIFAEKEVVEEVQDERTEVILEEAQQVNEEAVVGDMVVVESTPTDFGRVAAQTARQVIQQRIREAERNAQLQYFERQLGEIVSGVVQATSGQGITLGLDMKAEGLMPMNQKIPGERFKLHDRVRALIAEVKDGSRGPQIILSRTHRNFLRRLLENEVPEIYHGIVEIRAISREPGQRAKVAVSTTQTGVDPVGACVGVRGVRIQAIVKELHDEKIDIIEWNADPVVYISKALSPARVTGVFLNETSEGGRTATVVVQEDQLSLAIGRDGQNARLAAKLTGWRIDIKSIVEAAGDAVNKLATDVSLAEIAKVAVENVPVIEDILTKKSENRPVTPEEYQTLTQFVDRVERRTLERQLAEQKAEDERIAAVRAEIEDVAFELPLDFLGLPDYVFNILTEAEYSTVGDLILMMKLDSDKILGLMGIGPKAIESIETAIAEIKYPEPEVVAAEELEEVVTAEVAEEAIAEAVEEAVTVEEIEVVEAEPEVVEVEETLIEEDVEPEVKTTEEPAVPEEEPSLEELFKQAAEMFKDDVELEDEEDELGSKKKGKKKKKKHVTYEYDEDLGEVVSRKKYKRGDTWEDEW